MLEAYELTVCSEQGKLFELSAKKGYDSVDFINKFMNSETAARMDSDYDYLHYSGHAYIMETLEKEVKHIKLAESNADIFEKDSLFWIGYFCRNWYFYNGQTSREIIQIEDPIMLDLVYPAYHTLDCDMAVDRCLEAYESRQHRKSKPQTHAAGRMREEN